MNNILFNNRNSITRHIFIPVVFLLLLFAVFSCDGRADLNDPIGISDAQPLPITVIKIENISGAAIIEYGLPEDNNINYVEAVVEIEGEQVKTKGSFYTRTLTLEGFNEAKDYEVSLYSVSFSEVRSEPVRITVSPTTPPFKMVAEKLIVRPIFGGVRAFYENSTKAYLQIAFLGKDSTGRWFEYETLYTNMETGMFNVRGLEAVEQTFGIVCRDRWQNISDTVLVTQTPLFEELADISLIESYPLPSDITYEFPLINLPTYHTAAPATDVEILWDGEMRAPFTPARWIFFQNITTGYSFSGLPSSITINLGRKYQLSRFVFWPRSARTSVDYNQLYNFTHPRTFQLWGSNNPSSDGSYETWDLIGDFESVRPSGNTTPGNANSTELDRQTALNGESFDMPEDIPPYQFIRYKVFNTWGNQLFWSSSELQFYGSPIDQEGM